jgi:hypothetical protein
MTIKLNEALGRCLAGSAFGALIPIAFVPTAAAQWMPPWGAPFPSKIEWSLEAQGYFLTAPLMRRPGGLSRRRQRRSRGPSASHHRREKRTNP